jgi:hypothetical protein
MSLYGMIFLFRFGNQYTAHCPHVTDDLHGPAPARVSVDDDLGFAVSLRCQIAGDPVSLSTERSGPIRTR